MNVHFRRTGIRRYAVVVMVAGAPPRAMDPAPGFDDDIPHDLVHYVVEAELGLSQGVYGRAARGAGTFIATSSQDISPRQRAREQRKQQRRERGLGARDASEARQMVASERLAALSDLAWRRKHGQTPDLMRTPPVLQTGDTPDVERVVCRLDELAPLWRALPVGGELVFEWPQVVPTTRDAIQSATGSTLRSA